ncbi:MAG: galactokinase [Chitinophagaceae bacterium]
MKELLVMKGPGADSPDPGYPRSRQQSKALLAIIKIGHECLGKQKPAKFMDISSHIPINLSANEPIMYSIRKKFVERFGREPLIVSSPARVNLIGEHTDYNEGFVLPGAVDKKMYVAIAINDSETINAYANEFDETFSFSVNDMKIVMQEGWASYLLGVAYFVREGGHHIRGVDVLIDGNVPVGAGMSSSAALCSAFGFALNTLFDCGLSRMELAYIGQKTEHKFVGVMCGIMDQFASLYGKAGNVMKLDCRSMEFEYIPFDFPDHKIVMVNSMVKHSLAGTEYNIRRLQCELGVSIMKKYIPEAKSLRDIPFDTLMEHKDEMPEEVFTKCYFVLTENQRLLSGCKLLAAGDLTGFGKLMYETHQGLSKLYKVSCPELDFLAENAHGFDGVTGTRMMGGGFGGCTINLVEKDRVDAFSLFIKDAYKKRFGKNTEIYITQIEDGTKLEEAVEMDK